MNEERPESVYDKWKKSLKTPKGYSESVNRRTTDNTMTKWKRTSNDLQDIYVVICDTDVP
jgi:hypothetical protein